MELHLSTVEPGAGAGGAFYHEGEEFIMMLEGTLRVSINSIEHYLLTLATCSISKARIATDGSTPAPGSRSFSA
jgi:hypothetical protein